MKQLPTLIIHYQQKIFYFILILLLIGGAILPALANTTSDSYKTLVNKAIVALDSANTKTAYLAFAKARKLAHKNKDQDGQDAFRDCLKKIPFYEAYFPLVKVAEAKLSEEDYKNAQVSLLAALEQLDLSIEIAVNVPAFTQYEENKRRALAMHIQEIADQRRPLVEKAIVDGEEKLLQNQPAEALEHFYYARNQTLEQGDESREFRIGERIQKAEYHYDIYIQLNLARREAGYKNYREAQKIYQDALAKVERSKENYFPRLEAYDNQKYQEVQQRIDEVNAKRVKIYALAIARGQDYLEQDQPEEAIKSFSYAKQQMFEELREYQTSSVDQFIDQAQYSLLIREGDQQLQQSNYQGAIAAYQEAQNKLKSAEVTLKIEQAKENGYQQAVTSGGEAFAQGNYAEAQNQYQMAAAFKNTPELKNLLSQHYQQLLTQGRQETEQASYAQAKIHFENARLFSDTPEVQELIGDVQGGMDYASTFAAGEKYLRNGQVAAAKASFEQARTYQNSVAVQDQLFAIEDYMLALKEGRQALENSDPELARAYFLNAQDVFNTPEINDWIRQTRGQADPDRLAVQSYDSQQVFARKGTLTAKSIGSGSIDFNFNTVMWMRPDCSLGWQVELYNAFGTLTATEKVDGQCSFTFSNLPDGTYTYRLKLQENSGKTTIYRTANNEVVIKNGEAVTVKIDAKGKE